MAIRHLAVAGLALGLGALTATNAETQQDEDKTAETRQVHLLAANRAVETPQIEMSDQVFANQLPEKPKLAGIPDFHEYTVRWGDNLSTIAERHSTTLDNILLHNKIRNPNKIRVGQRIKIYAPEHYELWKEVECLVTNYNPTGSGLMVGKHKKWEDGKTSTMTNAHILNGVAVDPSLVPYGTIVKIPGFGFKVADDTGGRMRENGKKGIYHVDVRVKGYRKAMRFGEKRLKVKLYKIRQ